MKRFLSGVLCALLLWSVLPTALASGEPEEPAEVPAAEAVEAGPAEGESAAEAETEEPAAASEAPVPEEESELPLVEETDWHGLDPEDPLRGRIPTLDGAYGSTWTEFVTRPLNNETLRFGIDVSAYQNTIDWTKAKAAGVEFAFIRAAFRYAKSGVLSPDSCFRSHVEGAKAAGVKVGLYIFSQATSVKEAEDEADLIVSLAKDYDIDLPLVFDLEHYSGGRFSTAGLSRRQITDMCLAFCKRVEQAGYQSMVYSNPSMLNGDMYASELGRLWLANYTTQTSYTGHPYEFWQCSDHGVVDGVGYNGKATAVDLNIWFEPNGSSDPFTDVKAGAWYYDAVMAAYEAGIVKGMTKTTFQPTGTTTRAQLVTMLHRMAGEPGFTAEASFTDLTQDWYRAPVSWASELGLVKGYSEEEFRPNRAITREELVTILYRQQGEPASELDLSAYTDASEIHSWALPAMRWAVEKGILSGYEDGTLRPRVDANRAVVCTILMRLEALAA